MQSHVATVRVVASRGRKNASRRVVQSINLTTTEIRVADFEFNILGGSMQAEKVPINVKPGDSFDHWHMATCRNYSLTECRPIATQSFRGQISIRAFGSLAISDISTGTLADELVTVIRTSSDLRKDRRDDFQLWLTLEGDAVFAQRGLAARMQVGDLVLQDQAQPFALEFGPQHRAILVTIPRPLMTSRLPEASSFVARRIAREATLGMFASTIVRQLITLENLSDDATKRISASALDILVTALEVELSGNSEETTAQLTRLSRVKRYICANLQNSRLDLDTISKAQNISPRTLNRLFACEGTTPIRWLWQQRLAASFRALTEGRSNCITDVALAFGFSDSSHFSRAFKSTYGQSPQTLVHSACSRRRTS